MGNDNNKDDEVVEGTIVPYTNCGELEEFIDKPLPAIAEAITGAISADKTELLGSIGRIVQGVIKGRGIQQFGKEFKKMREKGAIKEDYANSKYGFHSFSELLQFIDGEVPDEERLSAVKAMFFNLVGIDTDENNEALNHKLFMLSQQLSASQLGILCATYEMSLSCEDGEFKGGADLWFCEVANKMGHGVKAFVEAEEKVLEELLLITPRRHSDRSGIVTKNCRLTDLGIKFCEKFSDYKNNLIA